MPEVQDTQWQAWFNAQDYFAFKLIQLNTVEPGVWDANKLESTFNDAGYAYTQEGMYRHFVEWGNTVSENVSPNSFFNVEYYKASKLAQLLADDPNGAPEGQTWTMELMDQAFKDAGLSYWDHYLLYGMKEGINPSEAFNTQDYLAAKLAQLQATEPDNNWTSTDQVIDAFIANELNPIEHWLLYGQYEDLDIELIQPAPAADFELSANVDNITGTSGDDLIAGIVASSSSATTLNAGDSINGATGQNTLEVDLNRNFNGFDENAGLTNIQEVILNNASNSARTFNAANVTGVENYTLNGNVKVTNIADANTGVTLSGANAKGQFTYAKDVKAKEATLDMNLDAAGTAKASATFNAAADDAFAALAVNASQANYVDLSGVKAETVEVKGSGSVNVSAINDAVKTIDASAYTGDATINAVAADIDSFRGGSGDDTLTVAGDVNATAEFDGGAGADTLAIKGEAGTYEFVMGGIETLDLTGVTSGALVFSDKDVTGLENVKIGNGFSGGQHMLALSNTPDINVIVSGDASKGALSLTNEGATSIDMNGKARITLESSESLTINASGTSVLTLGGENIQNIDASVTGSLDLSGDFKTGAISNINLEGSGSATIAPIEVEQEINITADGLKDLKLGAITSTDSIIVAANDISGTITLGALEATGTEANVELTLNAEKLGDISNTAATIGVITIDNAADVVIDASNIKNAINTTIGSADNVDFTGSHLAKNTVTMTVPANEDGADISIVGGILEDKITMNLSADGAYNINLDSDLGDDMVTINVGTGTGDSYNLDISGNMGVGTDIITISMAGTYASGGTLDLGDLAGYERASITLGTANGPTANQTITLGEGDDTIDFGNSGVGTAKVVINGFAGGDRLDVSGMNTLSMFARGAYDDDLSDGIGTNSFGVIAISQDINTGSSEAVQQYLSDNKISIGDDNDAGYLVVVDRDGDLTFWSGTQVASVAVISGGPTIQLAGVDVTDLQVADAWA